MLLSLTLALACSTFSISCLVRRVCEGMPSARWSFAATLFSTACRMLSSALITNTRTFVNLNGVASGFFQLCKNPVEAPQLMNSNAPAIKAEHFVGEISARNMVFLSKSADHEYRLVNLLTDKKTTPVCSALSVGQPDFCAFLFFN